MKSPATTALFAIFSVFASDLVMSAPPPVVRVALSRNLQMSGLWDVLAEGFAKQSGQTIEVVLAGEREEVAAALRDGRADLICIHDSGQDLVTALLKEGKAAKSFPWISSELVIVGPASDPAHVRGLKEGGEALRRIVATHTPLLDFHGSGSRETLQKLWQSAGAEPAADQLIRVERGTDKSAALRMAVEKGAYLVTGRSSTLPALLASAKDALEVMVAGDPQMRRVFFVLTAPGKNADGLAAYLASEEVLKTVKGFTSERTEGQAIFAPAGPP